MSKANAKSKNASENAAAESKAAEKKPVRTSPPNHIFIGKKPVMSYAMSALIQLAQMGEVVLKARGMVISRAVDVAEIITKRLGNNAYEVKSIVIDTEQVGTGEDVRNVSTIEIKVGRKQ
ncbi:MAG: DNA-binding protein Alba [Thaumarchaeota archaeon]|jgi:DNA-binding protein Alba|nr:DNA-binding protein Alba [Nitrososphaerota archaeon]